MYNEFQKRRYLESEGFIHEDGLKEVAQRIFETVSITEIQKGKDLSEFNKLQVIDLLKAINSRSKKYLRLVTSICFEYTNWQKIQGAIDNGNINYYDYSIAKNIIDELVPLNMIADKYFNEDYIIDIVTNKIKDPLNKFLTYAPYKGVCGMNCNDLKQLKYKDIDEETKTVKLTSGKILKVDDIFIKLAKDADEATEYMPEGTSYVQNDDNRIKNKNAFVYSNSDFILKSGGTVESDYKEVTQSLIIRRFNYIQQQVGNKFIVPSNLYKNGLINYIKERFEERGITLRQAFFEKEDKVSYVYTKDIQKYMIEYGAAPSDRTLRRELKEVIDLYE
jgi:hypothetical protein